MNDTDAPPVTSPKTAADSFSLRTSNGLRKYLNAEERLRFCRAAQNLPQAHKALCLLLYYTGCRISEALSLTANRIESSDGTVVLETLKQRRVGVFRTIPVPPSLLETISHIEPQLETGLLWPYARSTGYRIVRRVMNKAGIEGIQACPKGLRHSFGVACAQANIPVSLIKRWLGHARLETTMIYLEIISKEERSLVQRLWEEEIH